MVDRDEIVRAGEAGPLRVTVARYRPPGHIGPQATRVAVSARLRLPGATWSVRLGAARSDVWFNVDRLDRGPGWTWPGFRERGWTRHTRSSARHRLGPLRVAGDRLRGETGWTYTLLLISW